MKKLRQWSVVCSAVLMLSATTASAIMLPADGDYQAYYDPEKPVSVCSRAGIRDCADNEVVFLYGIESLNHHRQGLFSNVTVQHVAGTDWIVGSGCTRVLDSGSGDPFPCGYTGKEEWTQASAVHDGEMDEAVMPIPRSIWLFGSALVGFGFPSS